jgi:hypothetical protein
MPSYVRVYQPMKQVLAFAGTMPVVKAFCAVSQVVEHAMHWHADSRDD